MITAYRELLSLSALEPDIQLRRTSCTVPHDRDKLLKWVQDPEHLDYVAEAFRRVCSGYVSTDRLFAVCSGPFYLDWRAVVSMMGSGFNAIHSASVYMNISGRGKLQEEVDKLERALDLIKEVQDSLALADMLGSLPTPEERVGLTEVPEP